MYYTIFNKRLKIILQNIDNRVSKLYYNYFDYFSYLVFIIFALKIYILYKNILFSVLNKVLNSIWSNSFTLTWHVDVSQKKKKKIVFLPFSFSFSFSLGHFAWKTFFFRTRSGTIKRNKSSALFSWVLFFVETIRGESAKAGDERITTLRSTSEPRTELNVRTAIDIVYILARSSAADFRDENTSDRTRREGAYSGIWFFNARAIADARLYAKYGRGFSEAAARCGRGLESPTGDMHISSGRNEYIIHNLFRTVDL